MTHVKSDPDKVAGTPGSLTLAEPEKVRRVTTSEMLRALMARWETAQHERTSVEVSRNAQGKPQVKVSVAHHDPDAALTEAMRLYDAATLAYPYEMVTRPEPPEKG